VCEVDSGSGTGLILRGTVLTPGAVTTDDIVVVDAGGNFSCVGCGCPIGAQPVVRCGDAVISPGLINAHDHITFESQPAALVVGNETIDPSQRWEQRQDWRKGERGFPKLTTPQGLNSEALTLVEIRMALAGATSMMAAGSAIGFLRDLDELRSEDAPIIANIDNETFPLNDAGGATLVDECDYPTIPAVPTTPTAWHLAEGIDASARNELLCVSDGTVADLAPDLTIVQGVGVDVTDAAIMKLHGVPLIWSPRSNISLYGDTARVTELKALGVPIALGTDWIVSGSMNLLRELQCAKQLNDDNFDHAFTPEDLWRMVTVDAASVLHESAIGQIKVGQLADVAVFKNNGAGPYSTVVDAEVDDVALVLKAGQPLVGETDVVAAFDTTCDAIPTCAGASRAVCALRETGQHFDDLTAAAPLPYPLFFCRGTTPDAEPTCVPSRVDGADGSSIYDGLPVTGDADGDGIDDGVDNCPHVFNPPRPADHGVQPDLDADGVGDACDPCPFDADTTLCTPIQPTDTDGDGVPDQIDGCELPNRSQEDSDNNGTQDACEVCGSDADPCVVDVVGARGLAAGTQVTVNDLLVTETAQHEIFVMTDPAVSGTGASLSCIDLFFAGTPPSVTIGDHIHVTRGEVTNFSGQLELSLVDIVDDGGGTAPAPVVLSQADAEAQVTAGASADLQSCLLQVSAVTVSDGAPPPSTGATNANGEFILDDNLRVDSHMHLISPTPATGSTFTSITGIERFAFTAVRLSPRNFADVVAP
jgi:imidazolonepropionase-like amidohydrolase